MKKLRCAICRQHLPTLKNLKSHYMASHSKFQIIKALLKSSMLMATPGQWAKSRKKRKKNHVYKNVHITYSDDTIIIEDDDNSNDNLIEITFDEPPQIPTPVHNNNNQTTIKPECKKRKRPKKPKKLFHIDIKKNINNLDDDDSQSLNEHTGEFYQCRCMKKPSSDTESCSDTGKAFFCSTCDNGYSSASQLADHEKTHHQPFQCRVCSQVFQTLQHFGSHFEQHIIRVYVCHLCGFEFICKDFLKVHLDWHFEQQTFENILDMEEDYNMFAFCNTNFNTADYHNDINNIVMYLTYPYDHYYSRNMFMKVTCDICRQEFHIYDYDRHLKTMHLLC